MRLIAWIFSLVVLVSVTAMAAEPIVIGPLDRVLGKPDAPLTVVEYASMTCPHCARFHETVMPLIKADWIDTGKMKLVYRDLPTAPVGMAIAVAMITQCAPKEQYFPILALLFKNQEKWISAADPLTEIKRTVVFAGITPAEIDACLKKDDIAKAIQDRANEGSRLYGIESTPTLLVDGVRLEGETSYPELKKALDVAYIKASRK